MTAEADGVRPLDGLTVIDLTRQMSGPYASMVLGDFGADVIKVESAPRGDGARYVGNTFVGGESTMFLTWNRNKRSVCLDLRSAEGKQVLDRLIDQADIVMENYRAGVAETMGIGAEDVLRRNPRVIYCSLNAFGSNGPWSQRPGTDPVVQATSGVMSVTGERDGGPLLVGIPVADFSSAMVAVQGILLALLARDRTGRGQKVEIPMLHALVFGLTTRVGPYFATGEDPGRWGSQHSQVVPYQAFQTKDGYAVAGTWGDADWGKFCDALGWPELAADPRFDSNVRRVAQRDVLSPMLQERFVARTTAEWEERFSRRGVLFAPVNTFSDVFNHPQAQAMGLVGEVDHPTAGRQQQVTPAVRMTDTPGTIARPSPLLGEHSREVLLERGWSPEAVDQLVGQGIVVEAGRPAGASV
jgi:crotonobetainyl-CoA:carnitine CoA-transferase CaiB-like acyl-CoA transferase